MFLTSGSRWPGRVRPLSAAAGRGPRERHMARGNLCSVVWFSSVCVIGSPVVHPPATYQSSFLGTIGHRDRASFSPPVRTGSLFDHGPKQPNGVATTPRSRETPTNLRLPRAASRSGYDPLARSLFGMMVSAERRSRRGHDQVVTADRAGPRTRFGASLLCEVAS
jgi:hypothetical protein